MTEPLVIATSWPARILSPNASRTRDFWRRSRAKNEAKNEGFLATCAALNPKRTGPWGGGPPLGLGPFKVTIHAFPAVARTRDDDNLVAQCKALLDGIAQRLKIDDSRFKMQPVEWHTPGPPARLVFEVEVQS